MAITNGYCSLDQLKDRLGIDDFDDDTTAEQVITAVSRLIDTYTGRRFYATTDDETRYYTAEDPEVLFTDDIQSITDIYIDDEADRTYSTSLSTDDYDLLPYNAALDGKPYAWIEICDALADYTFPVGHKRGVKIIGKFGYCATDSHPDVVREACLIQSARIFKRKDTPFGVAGAPEFGTLTLPSELDPDVALMLKGVTRLI